MFRRPASLRSASLLQANWPERILKSAGLRVLNQGKPRCLAALGAANSWVDTAAPFNSPAEPADDDQDINS